jgi:hypothetical protein
MNRNPWIAVAALAGLSLPTHAEPLLSFGPDIPLFFTGNATVRRDDNVFLTSQDHKADTIFLLDPGIDMHYAGGEASASFTFDEQFVRYASGADKNLNDNLANVVGAFGFKGSTSQVSLAANYQQEDQSTLAAQNVDQTLKHSVAGASVNGEWNLTAKTSIGAGAELERTTYPEAGLTNSDAWSFPVDFYYAIAPKVDLSVGYRFDKTTLDSGIGDSTDDFISIGARGDFTPKLSGQIRVGVTELKSDQAGGQTGQLGLGMTLNYLFSPKTTLSLSADNGFTESALGTSQEVLSINSTAAIELSPAWTLTLGGSFDSTRYLDLVPARRDDFWVGDVGLGYAWTTNTNFQVSYLFRRNGSTLPLAAFDDDVLSLSASSRF